MSKEVIILMGFPASGKTTVCETYIKQGYKRLNRDSIGGTLSGLIPLVEAELKTNPEAKLILDNTYGTIESRAELIKACKEAGANIKCLIMETSIEAAQYNACQRMIRKYGTLISSEEMKKHKDPNLFPAAVLFTYRKSYQPPTLNEGFSSIEVVPFIRHKSTGTNKAILFDYDGTLRDTISGDKYPTTPSDIRILPKRKETLAKLKANGYILCGVSNQSGIAKKKLSKQQALECFAHTNKELGVDIDVLFCEHSVPPISCFCRKPMPGLGVAHIEKHKLDPSKTLMVGDLGTDKSFANRAGITFVEAEEFFSNPDKYAKF